MGEKKEKSSAKSDAIRELREKQARERDEEARELERAAKEAARGKKGKP